VTLELLKIGAEYDAHSARTQGAFVFQDGPCLTRVNIWMSGKSALREMAPIARYLARADGAEAGLALSGLSSDVLSWQRIRYHEEDTATAARPGLA
jgi:hypothetical protein